MKTSRLLPALLITLLPCLSHADDTLWNLTFKDLKPGQAPAETPFTAPCDGPQKVATDATDTLLGAATLGTLQNPLVFTKGGAGKYLPSLTLKSDKPYTTGTITVNVDLLFDHITPGPQPVETLMAIPFLNAAGGSDYLLIIVANGNKLILAAEGYAKGKKAEFTPGTVAHLKTVLDLDKHTFQAFLDDQSLGEVEHDDAKFSSFLGLTIRDGTAVGGNKGATFAAGISNLVVTHK
jgi:hypothetical protein